MKPSFLQFFDERNPIHTRTFHGNRCHFMLCQPLVNGWQIHGVAAKGTHKLGTFGSRYTDHDLMRAHIYPCCVFMHLASAIPSLGLLNLLTLTSFRQTQSLKFYSFLIGVGAIHATTSGYIIVTGNHGAPLLLYGFLSALREYTVLAPLFLFVKQDGTSCRGSELWQFPVSLFGSPSHR